MKDTARYVLAMLVISFILFSCFILTDAPEKVFSASVHDADVKYSLVMQESSDNLSSDNQSSENRTPENRAPVLSPIGGKTVTAGAVPPPATEVEENTAAPAAADTPVSTPQAGPGNDKNPGLGMILLIVGGILFVGVIIAMIVIYRSRRDEDDIIG